MTCDLVLYLLVNGLGGLLKEMVRAVNGSFWKASVTFGRSVKKVISGMPCIGQVGKYRQF